MNAAFKLTNGFYWLALVLWIAAIVTAAVAAMATFPTMRDLGVSLEPFQAYQVDDNPDAHADLASGQVLERVFTTSDFMQISAAAVLIVALLLQFLLFRMRILRVSNVLRILAIVAATSIFAWHVVAQAPHMNRELRSYWTAARAGDVPAALEHRAAFDEYHPRAERVFQINLALLLVALFASAAAFSPRLERASGRKHELETPALAKSR